MMALAWLSVAVFFGTYALVAVREAIFGAGSAWMRRPK